MLDYWQGHAAFNNKDDDMLFVEEGIEQLSVRRLRK
jgi:hypothetical protein